MQIHSVDNTTNFKALKINPALRPEITKRGNDFITFLNDYGKKIADIKLYDVVFVDNLHCPKILSNDKNVTRDFFSELKNETENLGKYYEVSAGLPGETVGGFFPDIPRTFRKLFNNDAEKKYKEFKKLDLYEQAAQYSRFLEELDVKRMVAEEKKNAENLVKEIQQKSNQEKLDKELDNLIEKYGTDYSEIKTVEVPKKPSKKNWWQRLFS